MLPGEKIISIFGFCDIRKFTNATEILKQGVMIFVNEIGHICHGIVDKFSGAANKNVGDAFLFVWKFDSDDMYTNFEGKFILKDNPRVNQISDMSVISFLLLLSGLKKSRKMIKYREHEGLNKRMPNYEVRLGMGLHLGYSVEGPLGSPYKIDPTYLSPHVKMSERLESSTKVYQVPLLISGSLYEFLSRTTKGYCRSVDYVVFKGKQDPMMLYTIDADNSKIQLEDPVPYYNHKEQKIKRVQDRMQRNNLFESACRGIFQVSSFFESDPELKLMLEPYTWNFRDTYKEAFDLYKNGFWLKARDKFQETIKILKESRPDLDDPLSQIHIDFMRERDF